MTKIVQVLAAPATGACYFEDLSALQAGAGLETEGRGIPRGVADAVSVGLALDNGQIAWGDCVSVADSDEAHTRAALDTIRDAIVPALEGRALTGFRELSAEIDALTEEVTVTRPAPPPTPAPDEQASDPSRRQLLKSMARLLTPYPDEPEPVPTEQVRVERPLHPAVRYGVSQALLGAVALARGVTMAEVIADEWGLPRPDALVPIHAQSGRDWYMNADKMIVRRVASLPHGLVDNIPEQVGRDGVNLTRYLGWLVKRIAELGSPGYAPTIHLDVHGALGVVFDRHLGKVLGRLYAMELAAKPYALRVECPVLMDTRDEQIEAFKTLREYIGLKKMGVQIVADEWANTLDDIRAFVEAQAADMVQIKPPELGGLHNAVEAVSLCQQGGVGAFLGGSCAETDLSARASVHVALATRPDLVMAKPGLGVDEAVSVTQNEMARALAQMGRMRNVKRKR